MKPVFPRKNQGLQCLSVEVVYHGPVDLLRNMRRYGTPSVAAQLRDESERSDCVSARGPVRNS